jgi:UDP-arabinose 4-epimerase
LSTTLNILVTGGAGYIGSHVCKALAAEGHTPITYDNLSRGNRWAVKWGPLEEGNIADPARVHAVLEKYRPAALMHFAAYAYVGESVQQPSLYYENNFSGTATLLRTLINFQRLPVVFSSTCATYGIPESVPIREDQFQLPINPYGRSKYFVEQLLRDLESAHGLPWVALRYFNAGGADPEGQIGEAHDPETHLIPLAINAARSGTALHVFGSDYDTPDGTCVRDYVHVSDIADAHVRSLKYLLRAGESRAFNLANARGYSVREVISTTEKVCRKAVNVQLSPRRPGDPAILIGDGSRARDILGWSPARSDLETQIRDGKNWIEKWNSIRALDKR